MSTITLHYLSDQKHYIPQLAAGIFSEWKSMYTRQNKNISDIEKNCHKRAITNKIPLTMIAIETKDENKNKTICISEDNNKTLLGSVTLKVNDMSSHPELTPWLAGVFVFPQFRGRGIGKILIAHAENIAKDIFHAKTIYLYTGSSEGLYIKTGYTVRERIKRNDKELVIMEKNC